MPLIRVAEPFDHPDWIFELKHDGFRALAHVDAGRCSLVSRRRHVYKQFAELQGAIGQTVHARQAILDGEVVCLAPDGRSQFYDLMFHRGRPHFVVFDVLSIDGEDLCQRPLLERKRRLRRILPRGASRLVYLDHVERSGVLYSTPSAVAILRVLWPSGSAGGTTQTGRQPPG
jgi:bifunctional non-homologous end joining protein LigD